MRFSQFQYDIPAVPTAMGREDYPGGPVRAFPNPSDYLRPRALRTTKSVWNFDEERTPWQLIYDMGQWSEEFAGRVMPDGQILGPIVCYLREMAESATPGILQEAVVAMRKELEERKAAEATSLATALETLQEVNRQYEAGEISMSQLMKARKTYKQKRQQILKRSETIVTDLESAAKSFGMDWKGIRSTQALVAAKAELYVKAAKMLGRAAPASPIAQAAANNDLPPEVLADMVEDTGGDTRTMRAAFAKTPPAPAAPKPPTNGNHITQVSTQSMDYDETAKRLQAEASSLGLAPGTFPTTLDVRSHRTGKVQRFNRFEVVRQNGQLAWVDYTGPNGISLRILND